MKHTYCIKCERYYEGPSCPDCGSVRPAMEHYSYCSRCNLDHNGLVCPRCSSVVAAEEPKTCRTCRWFELLRPTDLQLKYAGTPEDIEYYKTHCECQSTQFGEHMIVLDHSTVEISTDFGCIHYEEK